jgi:hypothetical protein
LFELVSGCFFGSGLEAVFFVGAEWQDLAFVGMNWREARYVIDSYVLTVRLCFYLLVFAVLRLLWQEATLLRVGLWLSIGGIRECALFF